MYKVVNGDDTKGVLLQVLPELRALNLFHICTCAPFLPGSDCKKRRYKNKPFILSLLHRKQPQQQNTVEVLKTQTSFCRAGFGVFPACVHALCQRGWQCDLQCSWWCDGCEPLEIASPFSSLTFLATASFCS